MKQQITTYNSYGQQIVLELGDGDTLQYNNRHDPFILPKDHTFTINREGVEVIAPKGQQ